MLTRRDFIHAGCAVAAASLVPDPVEAWIHGSFVNNLSNPLLSQRNIINLGFLFDFDYAWINYLTNGDNTVSPFGAAFNSAWSSTATYQQVIDQNGWPNSATASGQSFGGGVRFPASSSFSGPFVITWDGDGKFNLNAGTWTEASTTTTAVGNANGTTTLSGFSSVIGIAPSFGISGTGVSGGTTVVSVNYSTKSIVVSSAVTAGSGITFTFTNGTYTKNANGVWTNTTGTKPYIVVNSSGLGSPSNPGWFFNSTGSTAISVSSMSWSGGVVTVTTSSPHGRPLGYALSLTFLGATPSTINSTFLCTMTGASTFTFPLVNNPGAITGTITYISFATNAAIYRQDDEADFMPTSVGGSGYKFHKAFKQALVNLNPAAIRFLNWAPPNNNNCRFENRSNPGKAGCAINATAGPAYGVATGTNQYSISAVSSGTAGNSQTTPASMVHGELACARVNNASVRSSVAVSSITKANPGVVTTSSPHGFSTGDQVIFEMSYSANAPSSMVEMHLVACIITVTGTTTFTIADLSSVSINTTSFTTFTSGNVFPYLSMQVGSGNDRVSYPMVAANAPQQPYFETNGAIQANTYYTFYFDKNVAARRTAGTSANWVQGAWLTDANFPIGDVPIEYCSALIAETNILSKAQGINTAIHMWLNIPSRALLTCDPDYTTQSDWTLNAISAAFNGGFGCLGLSAASNASLIVEWANEVWNFGSQPANYSNWIGYLRGAGNIANFEAIQALRSAVMARSINSSSSFSSRTYKTIGMQGTQGWSGQNQYAALGSAVLGNGIFISDPWNTWGSASPLSFSDAINYASYFDPTSAYTDTTAGTGTFTDDSAMYNGTDNSGNGGGNYTGAANPTQAIANFVTNITNGSPGETFQHYCPTSNPSSGVCGAFSSAMVSLGKRVIAYEGGTDWACQIGLTIGDGVHTLTANDSLFVNAVNQSQAWATAQAQYFANCATLPNVGPQAVYTFVAQALTNLRWSYIAPDTYSGSTDGGAFAASPMWTTLGTRNQALSP